MGHFFPNCVCCDRTHTQTQTHTSFMPSCFSSLTREYVLREIETVWLDLSYFFFFLFSFYVNVVRKNFSSLLKICDVIQLRREFMWINEKEEKKNFNKSNWLSHQMQLFFFLSLYFFCTSVHFQVIRQDRSDCTCFNYWIALLSTINNKEKLHAKFNTNSVVFFCSVFVFESMLPAANQ